MDGHRTSGREARRPQNPAYRPTHHRTTLRPGRGWRVPPAGSRPVVVAYDVALSSPTRRRSASKSCRRCIRSPRSAWKSSTILAALGELTGAGPLRIVGGGHGHAGVARSGADMFGPPRAFTGAVDSTLAPGSWAPRQSDVSHSPRRGTRRRALLSPNADLSPQVSARPGELSLARATLLFRW